MCILVDSRSDFDLGTGVDLQLKLNDDRPATRAGQVSQSVRSKIKMEVA